MSGDSSGSGQQGLVFGLVIIGVLAVVAAFFVMGPRDTGIDIPTQAPVAQGAAEAPASQPTPPVRGASTAAVANPVPVAPAPSNEPPRDHVDGMRPVERALFGLRGTNLGGERERVVFSEGGVVATVYQDEGHASVNRATIDLDSDGTNDEKWVYKTEDVRRRVAPSDDGVFGHLQVWTEDNQWESY